MGQEMDGGATRPPRSREAGSPLLQRGESRVPQGSPLFMVVVLPHWTVELVRHRHRGMRSRGEFPAEAVPRPSRGSLPAPPLRQSPHGRGSRVTTGPVSVGKLPNAAAESPSAARSCQGITPRSEAGRIAGAIAGPRRIEQRMRAGAASGPGPAVLVVREVGGREIVVAACSTASSEGAVAGLGLMEARSLLRGLEQRCGQSLVARWDRNADAASLRRLGAWCLRFAPIVAIDPRGLGNFDAEWPQADSAMRPADGGGEPSASAGMALDLSGCDAWLRHLHGLAGEAAMPIDRRRLAARHGEAIEEALRRRGFTACVAAAPTVGLAWALALEAASGVADAARLGAGREKRRNALDDGGVARQFADEATAAARLAAMPIEALRIDSELAAALRQLQIDRVADLQALDRAEIAQRFGPLPLRRIDEALGARRERLSPVEARPPLRVEWEAAAAVGSREGVRRIVAAMVRQLCGRLRELERGVVHLRLRIECVDRPVQVVELPLGSPSRRAGHLQRLLEVHLERIDQGLGCERIELGAARSVAMRRPQAAIAGIPLPQERSPEDAAAAALADAVASRFEGHPLRCVEAVGEHGPERTAVLHPVGEPPLQGSAGRLSPWPMALRPTLLCSPPESIEVRREHPAEDDVGEIAESSAGAERPPHAVFWEGGWRRVLAAEGPERIAEAWWRLVEGGSLQEEPEARGRELAAIRHGVSGIRDYWRVAVDPGRWIWIFCEGDRDAWFLHGIWA
jgi:protein ImuB